MILISKQLLYIKSYDVNYDKNNIIILPVNSTPIAGDHYDAFVNEIIQDPDILNASGMRMIAGYDQIKEGFSIEGFTSEQERLLIPFLLVRHNFIQTFEIEIIAGRDFSEEYPTDETEAVLINFIRVREHWVIYPRFLQS